MFRNIHWRFTTRRCETRHRNAFFPHKKCFSRQICFTVKRADLLWSPLLRATLLLPPVTADLGWGPPLPSPHLPCYTEAKTGTHHHYIPHTFRAGKRHLHLHYTTPLPHPTPHHLPFLAILDPATDSTHCRRVVHDNASWQCSEKNVYVEAVLAGLVVMLTWHADQMTLFSEMEIDHDWSRVTEMIKKIILLTRLNRRTFFQVSLI